MEAIKVPAANMWKLEEKIAKLNKRAAKLGCEPVGYEIVGTEVEVYNQGEPNEFSVEINLVVPKGVAPVINGWKLIARLEHPGDMNLIFPVPGEECPKCYRTTSRVCEHCNMKRVRKDTFVVQNVETQEYKQVGRQCLRDFLGHNSPEQVVQMATWITGLDLGDESDYADSPRDGFFAGYMTIDTEKFLTIVATLVEMEGWKSRGAYMENSTASGALSYWFWNGFVKYAGDEWFAEVRRNITQKHNDIAKKAIAWMVNDMGDTTDYQWNLKAAAAEGFTTYSNAGILASGIVAYHKAVEQELNRAKTLADKSNEWIGNVKERVTLENLTVMRVRYIDGAFGTTTLLSMEDESGNCVVWFASNNPEVKQGDVVSVTGTIKKHDLYNSRKQTVLTRCKIQKGAPTG